MSRLTGLTESSGLGGPVFSGRNPIHPTSPLNSLSQTTAQNNSRNNPDKSKSKVVIAEGMEEVEDL